LFFVAIALAAITLALRPSRWSGVGVSAILGLLWTWIAVAYHLSFFTRISPAAYGFAAVSMAGAAVFIWQGLSRELVRYATLAPSSHNTRCWKFALDGVGHAITILPDLSRRCPAVDPDDHHVFVSLGCATENLVQAALAHGLKAEVSFDATQEAGRVVLAVDGLPDMQVPEMDREHMAGNHVLLRCAEADVLLGHLRPGSVQVHPGATVTTGTWLGSVGNSGNTGEPHLHVHAQRPGSVGAPLSGDPLPILFDGRFPVRGDRVESP